MRERKTFWRSLGIVISALGGVGGGFVAASLLSRNGPLQRPLAALLMTAAVAALVFGFLMRRGALWAAWLLRLVLLAMLIIGFTFQLFDFKPFSIPFISGAVLWLVLSFL